MPKVAITARTPFIDAVDLWWEIKRENPYVTAEEVAQEKSGTVRGGVVDGYPIAQTFLLDSTPCHFGNSRLWILCPGCERRVRVIYRPPSRYRFLCRYCHELTYESCNRSRLERRYPTWSLWGARMLAGRYDVIVN